MSSHYFTWGQQFEIPSEEKYKTLQTETGFFQRPFEDIRAEYLGGKVESSNQHTYNPQGVDDMEKPKIKVETGVSGVYSGVLPKHTSRQKQAIQKAYLKLKA